MSATVDRKKRRTSTEVRRLLVEEASLQFTERGYAATTMKGLGDAAGVAISVVYNHFESKGDLLREAVLLPFVGLVDRVGLNWTSLRDRPWDEEPLVRAFVTELFEGLVEHRGALLALIGARSELEPAARAEIDRALRRMFLELRAIAEESRTRGWRPSDQIDIQIRFMVTLMAGAAIFGDLFLPASAVPEGAALIREMTNFVRQGMSYRTGQV